MYTSIKMLVIFTSLFLSGACISHGDEFPCKDIALKVIQQNTPEEQKKEFEKISDVETQYCVYMYGFSNTHPPVMFPESIAKNPSIVPLLKNKLTETNDETEIWALCTIIPYLKTFQGYPVEHDKELMDLLTSAIGKVQNKDLKKGINDIFEHASIKLH